MNRRGLAWDHLIIIIMGIVVLLWFVYFYNTRTETTTDQIDSLQACQGFLGTLGGKEGKCFSDGETKCGGNVDASQGTYFQYIGKGWGCPEATHCCVQLEANANPLRATDVNRAKCTSELKEGEWAVQTGIGCQKAGNDPLTVKTTDQITFIYKPSQNEPFCQIHMNIPNIPAEHAFSTQDIRDKGCWGARNAENVVLITTSVQGYMDNVFAQYGRTRTYNDRVDRAWLNTPQNALTVQLQSGEHPLRAQMMTLSTTAAGTQYCPISSTNLCANQPVGSTPASDRSKSCQWTQGGRVCDLQ